MVKDQQEAEKKKVQSQEIQQQLAIQTVAINQKRDDVMADLAQVEPAVIDAQNGRYRSGVNSFNFSDDCKMKCSPLYEQLQSLLTCCISYALKHVSHVALKRLQ